MGKSAPAFDAIAAAIEKDGASLVKKTKGVIKFVVKGDNTYVLDLKNGNGSFSKGETSTKCDLTVTVSDDDFLLLFEGKLNPQQAFMKGKIKTKGNMGLAMKLNGILAAARPAAKL